VAQLLQYTQNLFPQFGLLLVEVQNVFFNQLLGVGALLLHAEHEVKTLLADVEVLLLVDMIFNARKLFFLRFGLVLVLFLDFGFDVWFVLNLWKQVNQFVDLLHLVFVVEVLGAVEVDEAFADHRVDDLLVVAVVGVVLTFVLLVVDALADTLVLLVTQTLELEQVVSARVQQLDDVGLQLLFPALGQLLLHLLLLLLHYIFMLEVGVQKGGRLVRLQTNAPVYRNFVVFLSDLV